MNEVESKYLVEDKEHLLNYLSDANFIEEKHEKDIYFDTKLGNLNSKGYYIRIRNNKSFDFKYSFGTSTAHEHCYEDNFVYPLNEKELPEINKILKKLSLNEIEKADIEKLKTNNNLIPLVSIDKQRRYYEKNGFTFCLDEVKDLGFFIEIEKIVPDEKVEEAKKEIRQEMNQFSYPRIQTGFIGLYLKRNHPEAYKRGRFKVPDEVWK